MCSHGHFDHTTGTDGVIRAVGRANTPVLIHPHFWRRRVRLPFHAGLEGTADQDAVVWLTIQRMP